MPVITIEPTATGSAIAIHNPTAQPLTAICLAQADQPLWEDELREPVPPGGDKKIVFNHPGPLTVRAAVYADGTWAGDHDLVPTLLERRRFQLDTARGLIKTLQTAQKQNTPKATIAGDLKVQADTLRVQPNREGAEDLILRTIKQLEGTRSYSDVLVDLLKEESNIATSLPAV
jgi:hypothetical protein